MSRTLAVAGIQMAVEPGDVNIDRMRWKLDEVCFRFPQVELALFSELSVYGGQPRYAEPVPGPAVERLSRLAEEYGLWLAPGSLYEKTPEGVYNTALVFNPRGDLVLGYRKMYPFEPYETSRRGDTPGLFNIPDKARLGLCVCYDQWFPELTRQLVWAGAEVILNPVMTTTADRPLELVVTQANAITNQVYFLSVNGVGQGGLGRSLLVDPEGRVLHQAGEIECCLTEVLDLDKVSRVREQGTLGMIQVLKSFRDAGHVFPVYGSNPDAGPGFQTLGPLAGRAGRRDL
ncbi:MAG: carbon-nitrogen hydrolase family protein [Thermodesulfobacteriota bacterium]